LRTELERRRDYGKSKTEAGVHLFSENTESQQARGPAQSTRTYKGKQQFNPTCDALVGFAD
jgi:hypothetical protein